MTTIAVIGDPVLDQIYQTTDALLAGGKMLGRFVGSAAGGTTSNFACAAAKLGLRVSMIGQLAAGAEADLHKAAFKDAGVDVGRLGSHYVERGAHTIIAIGPDGEKTLIYVPFPQTGQEVVSAEALADFDTVYVMAADIARIEQSVGETSSLICVDVDAAAGLDREALGRVSRLADVIFINDVGFEKLLRAAPDEDAVKSLLANNLQCVVCTGGAGTSFAVSRGADGVIESHQMSALRANVVDTTGAGDCFNAAFLARKSEGAPLRECLGFAMAAGALATETIGARASIPERSAVIKRAGQ